MDDNSKPDQQENIYKNSLGSIDEEDNTVGPTYNFGSNPVHRDYSHSLRPPQETEVYVIKSSQPLIR